jgi:hypothetical protein
VAWLAGLVAYTAFVLVVARYEVINGLLAADRRPATLALPFGIVLLGVQLNVVLVIGMSRADGRSDQRFQ